MSQITTKWIADNAITSAKLDSSSNFQMAGLNVANDATVGGNLSITEDLMVGKDMTIGEDLIVNGNINFGTLHVSGDATVEGNLDVELIKNTSDLQIEAPTVSITSDNDITIQSGNDTSISTPGVLDINASSDTNLLAGGNLVLSGNNSATYGAGSGPATLSGSSTIVRSNGTTYIRGGSLGGMYIQDENRPINFTGSNQVVVQNDQGLLVDCTIANPQVTINAYDNSNAMRFDNLNGVLDVRYDTDNLTYPGYQIRSSTNLELRANNDATVRAQKRLHLWGVENMNLQTTSGKISLNSASDTELISGNDTSISTSGVLDINASSDTNLLAGGNLVLSGNNSATYGAGSGPATLSGGSSTIVRSNGTTYIRGGSLGGMYIQDENRPINFTGSNQVVVQNDQGLLVDCTLANPQVTINAYDNSNAMRFNNLNGVLDVRYDTDNLTYPGYQIRSSTNLELRANNDATVRAQKRLHLWGVENMNLQTTSGKISLNSASDTELISGNDTSISTSGVLDINASSDTNLLAGGNLVLSGNNSATYGAGSGPATLSGSSTIVRSNGTTYIRGGSLGGMYIQDENRPINFTGSNQVVVQNDQGLLVDCTIANPQVTINAYDNSNAMRFDNLNGVLDIRYDTDNLTYPGYQIKGSTNLELRANNDATVRAQGRLQLWSVGNTIRMSGIAGPYANNAAALSAGLVAGDVYRDNGDPSSLCIVY